MTASENASMPLRAAMEFGSRDVLRLLLRQWKLVVAVTVIVALSAIVLLSMIRPQWEATATIRIGQIYDPLAASPRLVESLPEVLERMRTNSFLSQALKAAGESTDELKPQRVRIDPITSTSLIRVAAKSTSEEQSLGIVRAILGLLQQIHGDVSRAARVEAGLQVQQYTSELASLRETQASLQKAFDSAGNPHAGDGPSSMPSIASALERNAREIRDIDRQRFLLIRRDEYQSIPTDLIGTVSAVKIEVARKGLIVMFGIVLGLAAGFAAAVLRTYLATKPALPASS